MALEKPDRFAEVVIPFYLPDPETIRVGEEEFTLCWHNTLVMPVLGGDGRYDYLLHSVNSDPEDTRVLFFGHPLCPERLQEQLVHNGFPINAPVPLSAWVEAHYNQMILGKTNDKLPCMFEFID